MKTKLIMLVLAAMSSAELSSAHFIRQTAQAARSVVRSSLYNGAMIGFGSGVLVGGRHGFVAGQTDRKIIRNEKLAGLQKREECVKAQNEHLARYSLPHIAGALLCGRSYAMGAIAAYSLGKAFGDRFDSQESKN